MTATPQWRRLVDHVMSIQTGAYERNHDNDTVFGREFGENYVSWCVEFCWDMYHDMALDGVVPKVDNVDAFTQWAKARGRWSEYPSVGAWVNFHNGAHTEIVVGWNADHVFTKGGNTVGGGQPADGGQGDGVYLHDNPGALRQSDAVTGYFAPSFPDGVCPPTADPADYRGGKPVASWKYGAAPTPPPPPPPPAGEPVLDVAKVLWAFTHTTAEQQADKSAEASVLLVQKALAKEVALNYATGPGLAGPLTHAAYKRWQESLYGPGPDSDGIPGVESLSKLGKASGMWTLASDAPPPPPPPPTTPRVLNEKTGITYNGRGKFAAGQSACTNYVTQACRILGLPETYWVRGMVTIAGRESAYNAAAWQINTTDLNAVTPPGYSPVREGDGHTYPYQCSRGGWQCIPQTFARYHAAGTSVDIYDPVASAAAAIQYIRATYGVAADGHDLAAKVQQADSNRPPRGY